MIFKLLFAFKFASLFIYLCFSLPCYVLFDLIYSFVYSFELITLKHFPTYLFPQTFFISVFYLVILYLNFLQFRSMIEIKGMFSPNIIS